MAAGSVAALRTCFGRGFDRTGTRLSAKGRPRSEGESQCQVAAGAKPLLDQVCEARATAQVLLRKFPRKRSGTTWFCPTAIRRNTLNHVGWTARPYRPNSIRTTQLTGFQRRTIETWGFGSNGVSVSIEKGARGVQNDSGAAFMFGN